MFVQSCERIDNNNNEEITMSDKYHIVEKEFTYQDRSRANQIGTKYLVFNKRTNRKLGQHKTRVLAEQHLSRLQGEITNKRLSRKEN